MSEFKVGDRVVVPATIVEIDHDREGPYRVSFGNSPTMLFIERELLPASPPPPGKTVKVRAAVCVADDGRWAVAGATDWSDATSRAHARFFGPSDLTNFIEADVPIPDPQTIPGKVVPSDE